MQINVIEYFEKGSLRTSRDKIAVREQGRDYAFEEIERYAKNCAALILKRFSGKNQPIPVFLPKSPQNIVADIGILYSGNAYANLDIKSPPQRLKGMLQNLTPPIIITSSAYVATLKALDIPEDKLLLIEQAMVPESAYDNSLLLRRLESIIDTDPYCIIHTSGSTGIPKGVALNHRNTIDFVNWAFDRLGLDGTEIMGSLAPIYFDAYTLEFCTMLAKGATWVVVPEQLAMFPPKLVEFVATQPINFIFWVPTIMVNIANLDLLAKFKLDRVTKVFFIGEVFPTKHLNYWRRHLPEAMFVNLYGPIEITVACT
jgi:D-alanine--poly(phosphoribitol) ligase subunit 1